MLGNSGCSKARGLVLASARLAPDSFARGMSHEAVAYRHSVSQDGLCGKFIQRVGMWHGGALLCLLEYAECIHQHASETTRRVP